MSQWTCVRAAQPLANMWRWNLTTTNRRQLWIPRGFAHGFVVTSESADFFYKCDAPYSPKDEIVVRWDDPQLGIDWGIATPVGVTKG